MPRSERAFSGGRPANAPLMALLGRNAMGRTEIRGAASASPSASVGGVRGIACSSPGPAQTAENRYTGSPRQGRPCRYDQGFPVYQTGFVSPGRNHPQSFSVSMNNLRSNLRYDSPTFET